MNKSNWKICEIDRVSDFYVMLTNDEGYGRSYFPNAKKGDLWAIKEKSGLPYKAISDAVFLEKVRNND